MRSRRLIGLCAILSLIALAGCAKKAAPPAPAPAPEARPEKVRSWGYWLQHPNLSQLASTPFDLVVVDYSPDGTDEHAFTREEIAYLKKRGKIVLAYFSIGEAEDYRFYWQGEWKSAPPAFLGPENPEWPGNYKVKYWDESWWDLALRPYLDKILGAGFDGVYLDIVDAYWFWGEKDKRVKEAADEMVGLVSRIALYARQRAGRGFIVCPQNALGIIRDASPAYRERFFKAIDMVGVESVFYNHAGPEDQAYRLGLLKEFADQGKTILDIEYIPASEYASYVKKAEESGLPLVLYPAAPDRALDRLTPGDWR